MVKKRSDFKSGATSDEERYVTAKELKEALNAVKA
jgi:hypothetical protein